MSRVVSVTDLDGITRLYPRATEVEITSDGTLMLTGEGGLVVALYPVREVSRVEVENVNDPAPAELDVTAPCEAVLAGAGVRAHALSLVEDGYVRVWQGVDFVRQSDGRIVVSEARDDNEAFLDGDDSGSYRLSCYRCGKSVAAVVTDETRWA